MSAKKREIPAYERRLEEARDHIQNERYRSAVESASGGIELLMKELFREYRKNISNVPNILNVPKRKKRYEKLKEKRQREELKEKIENNECTLGELIEFYRRDSFFEKLNRTSDCEFNHINIENLSNINKLRNKCVHNDHQPSETDAAWVCDHFKMFIQEAGYALQEKDSRQDDWASTWQQEWKDKIQEWLERHPDSKEAQIVSQLVDQLKLVDGLASDKRVHPELRSQLMQAVIYVIESDDYSPEKHKGVLGLVDDAAVLALTLYWLDSTVEVDPQFLRDHWVGKDEPFIVINDLHKIIVENHSEFFSDEAWEIISAIAEKGPRVLWQMPK